MNIFKRFYCRTFQFFFKVAIPLLPYRQPKILQSVEDCAHILKSKNVGKAFIVTDEGVRGCGLCDGLTAALDQNSIEYSIYDKTMPNPTADAVEDARAQYVAENCKAIIAVGGGSAMDLAKACGARIVYPKKRLDKMAGILHVRKKLPPLFAVPTTAGTGSETTIAAVITDGRTHRKYAINSFPLIPHYAVLDYKLTIGLPKNITAFTGVAHSLSGRYGLPHGLTCSVLLPVVLESYGKKAHKKLAKLARACGVADATDDKRHAAEKFIAWIYETNEYLGIPNGFEEIRDEDVDKMSEYADKEGNPLYPVPKLYGRKQLKQLY